MNDDRYVPVTGGALSGDPYPTINLDNMAIVPSSTDDFSSAFLSSTGGFNSTFSFSFSISYEYNPQSDITAYELAQIIPYLHGRLMYETDWEKLGAVTRHLKRL